MALYRVPACQADSLSKQPESGMGFQVISARLAGATDRIFVALNSEYLLPADSLELLHESISELGEIDHPEGLVRYSKMTEFEDTPEVVASRLDATIGVWDEASHILECQSVVRKTTTRGQEAFFRYSAFQNDRRVHKNGSFRVGTYATTANDVRMVPSGFAAVGRYALPNPRSAKFVYVITPKPVAVTVGTVSPANTQAGGGVEVLFKAKPIALHGHPYEISEA